MRTAVAVAAVAAPLAAAGSAQAAIAGATPGSTTNHPDLVSAAATGANSIQVCYDKALGATVTNTLFRVTSYLSGTTIASGSLTPVTATVDSSKTNCVDLGFAPANNVDLGQGTVVTDSGAAVSSASGTASLADSTTLTSSTTNSGTAGHTAGPDLTSAKVASSSATAGTANTVTYTFDQPVDPANVNAGDFYFSYTNGAGGQTSDEGTTVQAISGNTVTIGFGNNAPGGTSLVPASSAEVAFVDPGAVYSEGSGNTATEVSNPYAGFTIGSSSQPVLSGAAFTAADSTHPAFTRVTYTFDRALTAAPAAGNFEAQLSDGGVVGGSASALSTTNPNQVIVTFTGGTPLAPVAEYAVQATYFGTSTVSSTTLGGNAGALAKGYTTGPDVQKVVSEGPDPITGGPRFLVFLDQRVNKVNPANISLLDSSGTSLGNPTVTNGPGVNSAPGTPDAAPGQAQVLLTFTAGGFFSSNGGQIQFNQDAFETNRGATGTNGQSVPQIVTAVAPSAHAKAIKHHHVKKHVKKAHR